MNSGEVQTSSDSGEDDQLTNSYVNSRKRPIESEDIEEGIIKKFIVDKPAEQQQCQVVSDKKSIVKSETTPSESESDDSDWDVSPSTSKSQTKKRILNDDLIYVDEPKQVFRHQFLAVRPDISAKKYILHECSPKCLPKKLSNIANLNPLAKPLLAFWERQIAKSGTEHSYVHYKAPCGRRLRDLREIKRYLTITACDYLDIDNFDFDDDIQVMVSYIVSDKSECPLYIDDISEGQEPIPIPAINAFENKAPPSFEYTVESIPTDGVFINKDPKFLFCCDCTDDCSDKMKCDCFRTTIENFSYGEDIKGQDVEWVSYQWKRLNYLVDTGIYECNSRCKCSKKCLNRVAQNPIQIKMHVFRTDNRGWGVQTCHDIPAGSFICIYKGQIYSEEHAEIELGEKDDCFAQLDLLENISEVKEGFERNAGEEETDNKMTPAQEFRKHIRSAGRIYLVDGKYKGNVGRFFNHSCDPNLFVQSVFLETHDLRFPSLALFAARAIKAGEELTWDYGYEIGLSATKVLFCKCGSEYCNGRIL